MRKFGIFASMFMAAFTPFALGCAIAHGDQTEPTTLSVVECENVTESGVPVAGMYFNTSNVMYHYEYDLDGGEMIGAVCYDDIDANLCNQEVLLEWDSYNLMAETLANGGAVEGTLEVAFALSDGTEVYQIRL